LFNVAQYKIHILQYEPFTTVEKEANYDFIQYIFYRLSIFKLNNWQKQCKAVAERPKINFGSATGSRTPI
jgi:hypothetical protein